MVTHSLGWNPVAIDLHDRCHRDGARFRRERGRSRIDNRNVLHVVEQRRML